MKTVFSILIGVLFVFIFSLPDAAAQDAEVKTVNRGIVNGMAVSLPKPRIVYPDGSRSAGTGGVVFVSVVIDEGGNVVFAEAGTKKYVASDKVAVGEELEPTLIDPALRDAAEEAARNARFAPTRLNGQPVKVKGTITYNFPDRDAPPASGSGTGGVLNGKASSLPSPVYPAAAKAVRAEGNVVVQISIDEEGNVVSANAISGHPLLRAAAAAAAREAKFSPTQLNGQPVKVAGVLTYNFVLPKKDDQ